MPRIDINTNELVKFTAKLERLQRSGLPLAVRGTLNDAAFDVKNRTITISANEKFIRRSPNFFKVFSKVEKAQGFDLRRMQAVVGMSDNGNNSATTAIDNMEKQEHGGTVNKGARYLADARGGNNAKKVTRANYFKNGRVLTGPSKRRTKKSEFVAKAFASKKFKAKFFHEGSRSNFVMQVTTARKSKDGKVTIKARKLMMSRKGSPANLQGRHFMKRAAEITTQRVEYFYRKRAEEQFRRILR